MTRRVSRSAGWACIALAKAGSLFCLWQVLRTADVAATSVPTSQMPGTLPFAAAVVLGAGVLGLRLLARGGEA